MGQTREPMRPASMPQMTMRPANVKSGMHSATGAPPQMPMASHRGTSA